MASGCSGLAAKQAKSVPSELAVDIAKVRNEIEVVLAQRTKALVKGKKAEFLSFAKAGTARQQQAEWWQAYSPLPLQNIIVTLGKGELRSSGYAAELVVAVKLKDFDRGLVETTHRAVFVQRNNNWLIASERATPSDFTQAPWEAAGAQLEQTEQVLVFGTKKNSDSLDEWRDISAAAAQFVKQRVPYAWDGYVVVIVAESRQPLRAEWGAETKQLGGVAVLIESKQGDQKWLRIMLPPSAGDAPDEVRSDLMRHEITHVALGEHDDHAPTWLREGIAEWIAGEQQRQYLFSDVAERHFPKGAPQRMVTDAAFYQGNWTPNYLVSLFSVQWLAVEYGSEAPWKLLKEYDRGRSGKAQQGAVLEELFGLTPNQLAQQATQWMLSNTIPRP
jgi:hypothetical protein